MRRARPTLDRIAAWFAPRVAAAPAARRAVLLTDPRRFATAQALIAAFYAALLFLAASNLYAWPELLATTELRPRWPVVWLRWVDLRAGIAAILGFNLLVAVVGVAASGWRWVRILAFVSWLELLALRFSFGSINHGDHLGLLIAFVLIFLPAGWSVRSAPRRTRAATQLVFAGCQGMILLTYGMSGMWKAGGIVEQIVRGDTSYLAPHGFAQMVAARLLAGGETSLLGPWFIAHPWFGWPLMLGAIALELFSVWIVARPALHRAWGLGLILLHLFSHLTIGVSFLQNILWLALFLVSGGAGLAAATDGPGRRSAG
jgi:hypothetical protein